VVAAAGTGGVAYIAREDCARVAAAGIAADRPPPGRIEVSGPAVVSNEELARAVSEVTGRAAPFVALSPEALTQELVASGLAAAGGASRVTFEVAVAGGYLALTAGAVEELTGRPPTAVRDFLIAARQEAPRQ
jgi:NAD(P)H dehydrogenase (quinone)